MLPPGEYKRSIPPFAESVQSLLLVVGVDAQSAVETSIKLMYDRVAGDGGCIAIDRRGNVGVYFNVVGMAWASCQAGVLRHGIFSDEVLTEPV